jgi:hypothetical protein
MPLQFLRNRPNAPVKAFYLDLLAYNGADLRQICTSYIVQDHVIAANHLSGVMMAAPFNYPHDKPSVGSPILFHPARS